MTNQDDFPTSEPLQGVQRPPKVLSGELRARALKYFNAAVLLLKDNDTKNAYPGYYLMFHSIELNLKSYLAFNGYTGIVLRDKFSHDIIKLYDECMAHGLNSTDGLGYIIGWIANMNSDDDFRYPTNYHLNLPLPSQAIETLTSLNESIHQHTTDNVREFIDFLGEKMALQRAGVQYTVIDGEKKISQLKFLKRSWKRATIEEKAQFLAWMSEQDADHE